MNDKHEPKFENKRAYLVDPEVREYADILEKALECEDDILNDYEREFASSVYDRIKRVGSIFQVSENQMVVINRIKTKLESEGLL